MKTYFELNGYSVIEHEYKQFANFEVTESNRCFYEIEKAILFCIAYAAIKTNLN